MDIADGNGYRQSEFTALEQYINSTEDLFNKKNYFGFALNMYKIGETVGRLNHAEGWYDNLIMNVNLAKNRPKGQQKNKENADQRKKILVKAGIAYFQHNRTHTKRQAAQALRKSNEPRVCRVANHYTISSLENMLKGCKETAIQELDNHG